MNVGGGWLSCVRGRLGVDLFGMDSEFASLLHVQDRVAPPLSLPPHSHLCFYAFLILTEIFPEIFLGNLRQRSERSHFHSDLELWDVDADTDGCA